MKQQMQKYDDYDSIDRFISYFYQIDLVKSLKPERILEVGVGNKTVSNYLKQHGYKITTCDFDKNLRPDHLADIRSLPFKDNSFDLVMACEILEHLPWEDTGKAIDELHRVTKNKVVISVPYSAAFFEMVFKIPFLKELTKKPFIDIFFSIPYTLFRFKKGLHYWEMGRKNHSIHVVRRNIRRRFNIIRELRPVLNPYHYFFVLEKK